MPRRLPGRRLEDAAAGEDDPATATPLDRFDPAQPRNGLSLRDFQQTRGTLDECDAATDVVNEPAGQHGPLVAPSDWAGVDTL